jgi:enamine deaminase RidA (YjgF/YER057c/UK114 family)
MPRETTTPEENFEKLRLELPPVPTPKGIYKTFVASGGALYVSGHGPYLSDGSLITGKVGAEVDLATGIKAAEQTGLAILATLKAALGSLNKIKRVVKVLGMVNCTDDFEAHPQVINGCSELFAKIWGAENGVGVRSAVGVSSLPVNISVEIEAIFELEEEN